MLTDILENAQSSGILRRIVFSKCTDKGIRRAVLSPIRISGTPCLQKETFCADGKALHENMPTDRLAACCDELLSVFRQADILTSQGNCTVMVSRDGRRHYANRIRPAAPDAACAPAPVPTEHNRVKKYILDEPSAVPFLQYLGVCDKSGRVIDRMRPKYRQINRFLEVVRNICPALPADIPLTVCDLCCGKAYLTFAVYWYLTHHEGRTVALWGVDRKSDVMAFCQRGAEMLGYDGMHFLGADITGFCPPQSPHLVISLHACDIATDLVLSSAVRQGAEVILSTPCCHHELMHQMQCPSLSAITRHSILKQKMCDAVTDSLRALRLEAEGYAVTAMELIDPEETPKNVLLRCEKRRGRITPAKRRALLDEYDRLCEFFGVAPSIGTMLNDTAPASVSDPPFSGEHGTEGVQAPCC